MRVSQRAISNHPLSLDTTLNSSFTTMSMDVMLHRKEIHQLTERKIRRFKQKLSDQDSLTILRDTTAGVLATCGNDMQH